MAGYSGATGKTSVLSPEAFCFLLDKDNGDRLEFQLMPDSIGENKNAMYNEIPIIGRSLPILGYASSTSRTVSLGLSFAATHSSGKYSPPWVAERVRWLESKVYPEYSGNLIYPPPRLVLMMGSAIGMQCVLTSYNTAWMGPWKVVDNTAYPMRAQVDIQLQEYGANDSESGHPFAHAEAKAGWNQTTEQGEGTAFVQIPLVV